jgi:hypothetical protein
MPVLWKNFLAAPDSAEHAVQVYSDPRELVESVATFVAAGVETGQPSVIVGTAEHWALFTQELASRALDVSALQSDGLLTFVDAHDTLESISPDGTVSPLLFAQVVGGLLDRSAAARPGKLVRVYGEMVDILNARGDLAEAIALEELWHDFAHTRGDFALLCAYDADVFDQQVQVETLPAVCGTHSIVKLADDPERFTRAAEVALDQVLGPLQAGRAYVVASRESQDVNIALADRALMWVSANMPTLAGRVLSSARANYAP